MKKCYVNAETFVREVIVEYMACGEVAVIVNPEFADIFLELILQTKINKKRFSIFEDYEDETTVEIAKANVEGKPILVTIMSNGDVVLEMYHPEYDIASMIDMKYIIEADYAKMCKELIKSRNCILFELDFDYAVG